MESQHIKTFRDLIVWQKSMAFVTNVYKSTKNFPIEETYSLTNQLRRCSVSIPSNIAEGFGRNSRKDFKRFLQIAIGSVFEIQTQLEISINLEYFVNNKFDELYEQSREIERLLSSFINKLK